MCRPVDRQARDSGFTSVDLNFPLREIERAMAEPPGCDSEEDSEELRRILAGLYEQLVEGPNLRRHTPFAYCTNRNRQLR